MVSSDHRSWYCVFQAISMLYLRHLGLFIGFSVRFFCQTQAVGDDYGVPGRALALSEHHKLRNSYCGYSYCSVHHRPFVNACYRYCSLVRLTPHKVQHDLQRFIYNPRILYSGLN